MVKTKYFTITNRFEGEPKETDFKLIEEELPDLKDGEFRTKALYWSVDPYMRMYVNREDVELNTVMTGRQIARVIESKNPKYETDDIVFGNFGWRTITNVNESKFTELDKLTNYDGLPYSLGLGILGRPGQSAYFGLLEICKPKAGQTVVVSGAAGAVGSHVGQIAKILGCRVIGFAGSDEKVEWLLKELNFDAAYNYKNVDLEKALSEAAPNGVDCYFDNVGGTMSSLVLRKMNKRGRIAVCGSISGYNAKTGEQVLAPYVQRSMINNWLRMEGFMVYRWKDRYQESVQQNIKWLKEGKLKYRETIVEGFQNMPKAFISLFHGANIGKLIVKSD